MKEGQPFYQVDHLLPATIPWKRYVRIVLLFLILAVLVYVHGRYCL